jgi:signal transduction histidine kinase
VSAADAEVVAVFLDRLAEVAPRLAGEDERVELGGRAAAVLSRAHARLDPAWPAGGPAAAPDVGAARASTGVHPAESLRAAAELFRQALPALVAQHPQVPPERVALVLHGVVDEIVVPGAVSYVDVLLARISDANRDERRRVARDLHDSTSHGIGAAVQGIDLVLHLLERGSPPDVERLRGVRQVLADTLDDVRGMATRLRDSVGGRSLGEALRAYLDLTAYDGPAVTLTVEGEQARPLPAHVKEEAYLIVREAVRNSLLHARGATRLDVAVVVTDGCLEATVADDGAGFDPATVDTTRTVGLASMRERAQGLGGRVTLQAGPGGVRLALTVPVAAP